MNKEVLYDAKRFNVVKITGDNKIDTTGIEFETDNVIVFPYTLDRNGNLEYVGIINEANNLRKNGFSDTVVSGTVEENETFLQCAKRELLEETGYNVEENEKWNYCGKISATKACATLHPCFLVDISNLTQQKIKGDGSKGEKLSEFKLVKPSQIIKSTDALVLTMLFKYFLINYHDIF